MHSIYNLLTFLTKGVLHVIALFNPKIRKFLQGRKHVFDLLQKKIDASDQTIWFHCASLGEFEQGVPVIEKIKESFPNHKIVVSFFSPSGYENKKNTPLADVVIYLPLDTPQNAKRFLKLVHPSLVFFVKYEFWPNYLFEIQRKNIPVYLISGVFRKNQLFFKSYGGFMRKALHAFNHFFVQEKESEKLLNNIGFTNVSISGDTRFDRVSNQLKMDNTLPFAEQFLGKSMGVVFGSTWPEDEEIILDFINQSEANAKFIIAPHQIETKKIDSLIQKLKRKTLRHSEISNQTLSEYDVLIIDCIGLLGRLYSYADVAYVGGAAGKTGLHNILEPATFGIPIIIGKNYSNFPEAVQLHHFGGLFSVQNSEKHCEIMEKLISNPEFRKEVGHRVQEFVYKNTGATDKIIQFIEKNHGL